MSLRNPLYLHTVSRFCFRWCGFSSDFPRFSTLSKYGDFNLMHNHGRGFQCWAFISPRRCAGSILPCRLSSQQSTRITIAGEKTRRRKKAEREGKTTINRLDIWTSGFFDLPTFSHSLRGRKTEGEMLKNREDSRGKIKLSKSHAERKIYVLR